MVIANVVDDAESGGMSSIVVTHLDIKKIETILETKLWIAQFHNEMDLIGFEVDVDKLIEMLCSRHEFSRAYKLCSILGVKAIAIVENLSQICVENTHSPLGILDQQDWLERELSLFAAAPGEREEAMAIKDTWLLLRRLLAELNSVFSELHLVAFKQIAKLGGISAVPQWLIDRLMVSVFISYASKSFRLIILRGSFECY